MKETNREIIRENSLVIYIDRPTKFLATKNRPLSQRKGVYNLYRERANLYHGIADIKVNNKYRFGREKRMADEHVTFKDRKSVV